MTTSKPTTVDEYIASFPEEVQTILTEIRVAIQKLVPEAQEAISYGMPAFKLNGSYLIYFAAYKSHIGIYPIPSGFATMDRESSNFKLTGKGTLQLPLNKPVPWDLIPEILKYSVADNLERTAKKRQGK